MSRQMIFHRAPGKKSRPRTRKGHWQLEISLNNPDLNEPIDSCRAPDRVPIDNYFPVIQNGGDGSGGGDWVEDFPSTPVPSRPTTNCFEQEPSLKKSMSRQRPAVEGIEAKLSAARRCRESVDSETNRSSAAGCRAGGRTVGRTNGTHLHENPLFVLPPPSEIPLALLTAREK